MGYVKLATVSPSFIYSFCLGNKFLVYNNRFHILDYKGER